MQNVQTEPKGNPKAYVYTPRGDVCAEHKVKKSGFDLGKSNLIKGG